MLRLYANANVSGPIVRGLRLRDIDVVTAQENGRDELPDPELLDRVTSLGRVLFTMDADFLAEASRRQREGTHFTGVIYLHQRNAAVGRAVEDLELIARVCEPGELENAVWHLPLT